MKVRVRRRCRRNPAATKISDICSTIVIRTMRNAKNIRTVEGYRKALLSLASNKQKFAAIDNLMKAAKIVEVDLDLY